MTLFQLCESCLLPLGQRSTSLNTLMFFNIITYCAKYVMELFTRSNWRSYETIATSSEIHHLGLTATKVTLEWTKLVVFFMTLLLSGLGISLGIEIQGFTPSVSYLVVTGFYFLTMEPLVEKCLPGILTLVAPDPFDGQERMWAPIILKSSSLVVSLLMTTLGLVLGKYKMAAVSCLVCVHLKIRDIQVNAIQPIRMAEATVARFPFASPSQLCSCEDICAICLAEMRRARVTYCGHLFHSVCLAQSKKISPLCPICKQVL